MIFVLANIVLKLALTFSIPAQEIERSWAQIPVRAQCIIVFKIHARFSKMNIVSEQCIDTFTDDNTLQ